MKNILEILRNWVLEAFSAHNDGWTQNGYRRNLIEIKNYLNNIDNLELHGEEEEDE